MEAPSNGRGSCWPVSKAIAISWGM